MKFQIKELKCLNNYTNPTQHCAFCKTVSYITQLSFQIKVYSVRIKPRAHYTNFDKT